MKHPRLEAALVYVGRIEEPTSLRSEYENLIAVQGMCAGDQIRPVPASSWQASARPRSHTESV
jgi:hypothetical protein